MLTKLWDSSEHATVFNHQRLSGNTHNADSFLSALLVTVLIWRGLPHF